MPFLFSAANSSGWLPQHQTPTVLPFIFLIVLIPLDFHVSSVMPLRANTCATETILPPFSRVANRFGSQSRPMSAPPPITTCSGVMFGPPTLMFTSSPALLVVALLRPRRSSRRTAPASPT